MIYRILLFAIVAHISSLSQAQNLNGKLFGVYKDLSNDNYLMTLDTNSATITDVDSIEAVKGYYATSSAADRQNGVYYLGILDTADQSRLVQLNMSDGSEIACPTLDATMGNGLIELQYHHGKQKLYGLNAPLGTTDMNVVEVNPSDGIFTLVAQLNPVASKTTGSATIDEIGNRLFFNGNDGNPGFTDYLFIVDLDSGTYEQEAYNILNVSIPPFEMEYDPIDERLYGLFRTDFGDYQFVRISASSASVQPAGTNAIISDLAGVYSGTSTFDPIGRRYFFTGFDTDNKNRLYVIDVEDGSVISNPEFATVTSTFGMELQYIHEGVNSIAENQVQALRVYPNPADEILWLEIPTKENCQIEVLDMMGKVLFTENRNQSGLSKLEIAHLPAGIYSVQMKSPSNIYAAKIVVQ